MADVFIDGGGIAACCCAALLVDAGHRVFVHPPARPGSPVLMLSDQTQRLLRDVFRIQDVFEGAVRIRKRIVAWGENAEAVVLPHSGLAMSESALLDRIWPTVSFSTANDETANAWRVVSSHKDLPRVEQHGFGSRTAATNSVTLAPTAHADACWVESTRSGWLFLLPCGDNRASLISVGATSEALLEESRLVAQQIVELGSPTGQFPAYPRIISPLCGPGWIACGTAAIAFDPIAGEGAGNAIREGILVSAVIRAVSAGLAESDLLSHYSNRLLAGFLRHLKECCQFYAAAGTSAWWRSELEQMRQGVEWAQAEMSICRPSGVRLVGFELQSAG
jgi:2-polyprenyl-6-methoxyphenol hydroxylase-like FAD-dependent oxidoreductase